MSNTTTTAFMPPIVDVLFNLPLYEILQLAPDELSSKKYIWALFTHSNAVDGYCPACGDRTLMNGGLVDPSHDHHTFMNYKVDGFYTRAFHCSRNSNHVFHYVFLVNEGTLTKTGQHPSLADLQVADIKNYRNVLPKEDFRELSKAVGLASHGVGIGSFVYLRRIFERLIEEAHGVSKEDAGWDEDIFRASRMAEKIELLKAHLPEFLVRHKALYGVLSRGIHELDEDTCLKTFAFIKAGIEAILDEKIVALEKKRKANDASKAITAALEILKREEVK